MSFKVYSQFGEDGIIQYLINNLDIKKKFSSNLSGKL